MRLNENYALPRVLLPLLSIASSASAWYLPGVAPTSYKKGDPVPLYVNHLTPGPSPADAQVRSVIPWNYYEEHFHFCKPKDGPQDISESLGSILFGDRIQTSPFDLRMAEDQSCKVIRGCGPQNFSPEDAKFVNEQIFGYYNLHWLIDGLPAGETYEDADTHQKFTTPGFGLGYLNDENTPVLNNHFNIYIDYHKAAENQYRVVGVEVDPISNAGARDNGDGTGVCGTGEDELYLDQERGTEGVVWTYSVIWQPSDTPFATRWDKYLRVEDPKIHWLSLINSAVIVIFLSSMVFVILVRTLRKDITRYNRLDQFVLDELDPSNGHTLENQEDGVQEDSGWKLVHGDVFRPPKMPLLLSVLAGNGMQLFLMAGFTIAFALLGFLSPSNRGSLGSMMVLLYTILSGVGGYVSSTTYKNLGGEDRWKYNIIITPTAIPLTVFSTFFLLNLFLWAKGSSGAVPFTTMLVIVLIWFLISLPLSFAGSWFALKKGKVFQPPVKTNQIPRQIPEVQGSGISGFFNRPIPSILLAGIPPFIAIFSELYFIMNSLWSSKVYYMFGFLFVCFGLMVVTCATVTVLTTYFLLCAENYHWQWRAFFTSGSCAAWIFFHALLFWFTRLSFQTWTSSVLYFGYSALISLLVFVLTGTIGFFSSWVFVHTIYRSIKVD